MEWLWIIAIIGYSIYTSVKDSKKAKEKRAQRQQTTGQTVYRSSSGSIPMADQQAARKQAVASTKTDGDVFDKLSSLLGGLSEFLEADEATGDGAKPTASHQPGKPSGKGKKKAAPAQAKKKSPSELPKQTLMEQRPDREQREAHTLVTANVKPLKNAFDNPDQCGHRMELNPNIHYSNQHKKGNTKQVAAVPTDSDSLIQGLIWSEILGKPKAYQRRENRLQR